MVHIPFTLNALFRNFCLDLIFSSQAQERLSESSKKLDLLRYALEIRRQDVPPDSNVGQQLKRIFLIYYIVY